MLERDQLHLKEYHESRKRRREGMPPRYSLSYIHILVQVSTVKSHLWIPLGQLKMSRLVTF